MLDKYIDWDKVVMELLKNRQDNQIALQNLREQYSSLTQRYETDGLDADAEEPLSDGRIDRRLEQKALKAKIFELTQEEILYTSAWNALTEEDRCILQAFFQCGQRPSQEAVDCLCEQYGYERATIYRMRASALKRWKRLIAG